MSTKFEKHLSRTGQDALDERSKLLAEETKDEQEKLIRSINDEIRNERKELARLNDLGVLNRDSLVPGNGMDPNDWVLKRQAILERIEVLNVKKRLAESTLTEWFGEETK